MFSYVADFRKAVTVQWATKGDSVHVKVQCNFKISYKDALEHSLGRKEKVGLKEVICLLQHCVVETPTIESCNCFTNPSWVTGNSTCSYFLAWRQWSTKYNRKNTKSYCVFLRFNTELILHQYVSGTQYLFLPPNRYIFHGAEVYSDSEDDVISSSSCGSSSDSGSCHSPSLDIEDESEIEEFYNGIEEEDAAEREEDNGFGEDGIDQEPVDESVSINETVGLDNSVDKL